MTASFSYAWRPPLDRRANLIVAHGYGEHAGRYESLAAVLNERGIAVYAYDQPGHGRSAGSRAVIDRFGDWVDAFAAFVRAHQRELAGRPCFLMGHSLGALVVGHYAVIHRPRVDGLIFSSGVLKIGEDISPLLQRLSGVLSAIVPRLALVPIRPELTSRIPAAVTAYTTDPLIYHGRIRARTGHEILKATAWFDRHMDAVTDPLLIVHGEADKITDPSGSRALYARAASTDKALKMYPGAFHEMMHDENRDEFAHDIAEWISDRVLREPEGAES